jgi:hypothetical protein
MGSMGGGGQESLREMAEETRRGDDRRNEVGDQGADRTTDLSHWCTEINNFSGLWSTDMCSMNPVYDIFLYFTGHNYIPQKCFL